MKRPASLRHLLLALPLLAALLCTSCQRHSAVWPQLLEAEALLDTDLPAAASLLDSVDATPLRGEDAALYAILKTQADYKRYVPLTSDSLPRLATAYYGTPYRKNYHAAMAWYSLGCYYMEQKDDVSAIEVFLRAKDLFPDTLSRYHALCYQNIGKNLSNHNMPEEAIPYLRIFRTHPACLSDSSLIANADHFLGLAYLYNSDFDHAEEAFYSVLSNPFAMENDVSDVVFQLSKLMYQDKDNYGASIAFINKYISDNHSLQHAGALWLVKGDIFYQCHELDSALVYYKRALHDAFDIYTQCNAYKQLLKLAPLMNENDSIPSYSAHYTALQSEIFNQSRRDDIYEVEEKHEVEMNSRQNTYQLMKVGGGLLAVAILIFFVLVINRKNKNVAFVQDEKDIEANVSPISKQELIEQCKHDFFQSSAASLLPINHHFDQRLPLQEREDLEHALKSSFAKIEESLSSEFADMTSDDALLCAYMLLDLPTKEIVACSRFTTRSVASRKSRLRSKLSAEWLSILFDSERR